MQYSTSFRQSLPQDPPRRDDFALLSQPSHPEACELLAYWRACMAKGGFVMGRDVPARPIARLLRNVAIYEPTADGTDLRARLAGVLFRRRFDGDIKGRLLSELFPPKDFAHHIKGSFAVLRTGIPAIVDSRIMREDVLELHLEVLLLPVTARDLVSQWLLAAQFYFD